MGITSGTGLVELGSIYDTDKQRRHKYLHSYDKYMKPYTDRPIKMFEIGILGGQSLLMWREYLHNQSEVYGIDITYERVMGGPNTLIEAGCIIDIVDQRNKHAVTDFCKQHGPFDIIIDDGDHQPLSQQMCFGALFQYVRPNGLYIVEDLHTSYNPERLRLDRTQISTIEVLKNLREIKNGYNTPIVSDFIEDHEIEYIKQNATFCDINRFDETQQAVIDVSTEEINRRLLANQQILPSELAFIGKTA